MSLLEYAEYTSSPQIANPCGVGQNGPNSFSISWINTPNPMGVKPPNPQFQQVQLPNYIKPVTLGASPDKTGNYPIGVIQSRREPYAVEYMYTRYGNLESRLGTGLGT